MKSPVRHIFLYFLCFFFIGCLENKQNYKPGNIHRSDQLHSQTWTYTDNQGQKTAHLHIKKIDKQKLYRLTEKTNDQFQDTQPIQALLVAINQYSTTPLYYCKQDMQQVKQYLQQHFQFYEQKVHIIELYDTQATKKNIQQQLQKQIQNASLYSTTIFAFSGHGTQQGLKLYDQDISIQELFQYYRCNKTKRTIWIIDSCYSGTFSNPIQLTHNTKLPIQLSRNMKTTVQQSIPLFPQPSPYSFLHCFFGQGKLLLCSAKSNEKAKDGIFIPTLISHLQASEHSVQFPRIINNINQSITQYNQSCRPENILAMTPFFHMQGDIQLAIIPY